MIGALLLGAWSSKESVEAHNRDIAALRTDIQRVLDVVCEDRPTARACR